MGQVIQFRPSQPTAPDIRALTRTTEEESRQSDILIPLCDAIHDLADRVEANGIYLARECAGNVAAEGVAANLAYYAGVLHSMLNKRTREGLQ